MPTVVCVIGTRPDAIKMAPIVLEFQKCADSIRTLVVSTGQHREILTQVLRCFGLAVNIDLDIMREGQTLAEITSRALIGIDKAFQDIKPDYVLLQGDTTSSYVASLAAFYNRIPCGHVEAGLRTNSVSTPFPEEFNRRSIALLAKHHFAPTAWAAANLAKEGLDSASIYTTGNTGIDALKHVAARHQQSWFPDFTGRLVLLTTHRRENWGEKQREIAQALLDITLIFPDTMIAVALHPNPRVREVVVPILEGSSQVKLLEPPEYSEFVKLMERSCLILTDSGGIQEEAPSFGVPVLILREETERPEGVEAGVSRLVGTRREDIVKAAFELLGNSESYDRMARVANPFGDGLASARIRSVVLNYLGVKSTPVSMYKREFAAPIRVASTRKA